MKVGLHLSYLHENYKFIKDNYNLVKVSKVIGGEVEYYDIRHLQNDFRFIAVYKRNNEPLLLDHVYTY